MLNETDIQESVLDKIRSGGAPMHSRRYFVLRALLTGAVATFILACALFVLSFAAWSSAASGKQFLLEFGERGVFAFLALFPWQFVIFSFALLAVLELFMREYTPIYRFPLLRVFAWIVGIGIVGSALLALTPLHSFLLSEADRDRLPIIGGVYEQIHDSHEEQGVYRGDVTAFTATGFVISHNDNDRDSDDGTWTVVPPAGFNAHTLSVGEKVYVAGPLVDGIVHAYGVHPLPNGE
ncbi:MAG: hypothetical protein WAN50_00655 [Minisyncoccia bacterium]